MQSLIISLVYASGLVASAYSETLETPAQGLLTIEVASSSEALVGAPLHRTPVFTGVVESTVESWLSPSFGEADPNWVAGSWMVAEDGSPRYYALIESGEYEGFAIGILDNTSSALELDIGVLDSSFAGEAFKVIPYWTLATLFDEQAVKGAATDVTGSDAEVEVRLFSVEPKSYKTAEFSFYYYTGDADGGPGWRMVGADSELLFDDTVIAPGDCMLYRNLGDESVKLGFPGTVQWTATSTIVSEYKAANDSFLSLASAVPASLKETRLYESGAFLGTSIITGLRGDLLMLFDNDAAGLNKSAVAAYYYYTGSAFGGPGWRKKGARLTDIFDDAIVFKAGAGFAIRKNASRTESNYVWSYYPNYLQD